MIYPQWTSYDTHAFVFPSWLGIDVATFDRYNIRIPGLTPEITICGPSSDSCVLSVEQAISADIHAPTAAPSIKSIDSGNKVAAAGMVIIPMDGGRGPVINNGEVISVGLLKSLLVGVLSETEFTDTFNQRIDDLPFFHKNKKEQQGYATHGDLVVLDASWTGYPPTVDLFYGYGESVGIKETIVGTDPDCIIYHEIPKQEVIYGYSGIHDQNKFTVAAAIVEKTDPVIKTLDWVPSTITGPPNLTTTESPEQTTTAPCMGIKINGKLSVTNTLPKEVTGTMYLQISIDSGDWINVAQLRWHFYDSAVGYIDETVDTLLVYDQADFTYKFRGQLVVDSGEDPARSLTGGVEINSVTESGFGLVLSNDLYIKWVAKE